MILTNTDRLYNRRTEHTGVWMIPMDTCVILCKFVEMQKKIQDLAQMKNGISQNFPINVFSPHLKTRLWQDAFAVAWGGMPNDLIRNFEIYNEISPSA